VRDEISELLEEAVDALLDARWEIRALRELLIERNLILEKELDQRIEKVKTQEFSDLREKSLRAAFEAILRTRPKQ
jgi:hypothetical protein